jgi:hypothetical protein
MKKNSNSVLTVVFGFVALALVGCDNQTTKSLCENPSGPIEGITGVYDLNFRDQKTFGIQTSKIEIMPNGKILNYKVKGEDDEDSGMIICNTGGQYVLESKDKESGMFTQSRFYTSQVGLHFNPVMYDKTVLDAAGIPNKLVAVPANIRGVIGEKWANRVDGVMANTLSALDQEDAMVLYVDNKDVSPSSLLQYSKPLFVGFTLFRQ